MHFMTRIVAVIALAMTLPTAYADFKEGGDKKLESKPAIEEPNFELQVVQQCVEGGESLSSVAVCVSQRLTIAEFKKCLKSMDDCYGKNNTLRRLIDGTLGGELQDNFNRSDLGKAFRGELQMPSAQEIGDNFKRSDAGKTIDAGLKKLGWSL